MSSAQRMLGQILVEMGILDERKVNEALEYQKRAKPGTKIGQAMVELGFCDEVQITKGLCRQFRLPFVDISRLRIPPAIADLVSKKIVADFNVVPVKLQEGKLILAAEDPMVTFVADDLRFALNREIVFALTPPSALRNARAEAYGLGEKVEAPAAKGRDAKAVAVEDQEAPIIRLVQDFMERALTARASDIHVEPMQERVRVRYRVDGVCYEAASIDAELAGPVVTRLKVLAKMDIAEKRKPQDGRIQIQLFGRPDRHARVRGAGEPRRERRDAHPRPRGGPRRPRQARLRRRRPRALREDHPPPQRHLPRHRARRARARRRRSTRR